MKSKKLLNLALLAALLSSACVYIVLPEGLETREADGSQAQAGSWSALATQVGPSESGDLRIDLTLRNDTGDWSTLQAMEGQPARLIGGDGEESDCATVFVGTGGHRLPPGFQMRGYTAGTRAEPQTQMIYVECAGLTEAAPGSKLEIDYLAHGGELDDYKPEDNQTEGVLEVNLDEIAADLTYPVAAPVEGLILAPGDEIPALSDNVVSLLDAQRSETLEAQRSETGFTLTWQNFNPTKFPLTTHIGEPPVIGELGILYGLYRSIDMAKVPLTPAGAKVEWTTEAFAPADESGFYILTPVELKKPRTYLFYVIDISTK